MTTLNNHRYEISVGIHEVFETRPILDEAFQRACFHAGRTNQPAQVYDTEARSGDVFMWEVNPKSGIIVATGRRR